MKMFRMMACVALVALVCAGTAAAQAQDYVYTVNNGTVTITGYTGAGGDITIPGTIEGLPVTSIGDGAFYDCTSLTSVTIGNSVTSIGDKAFWYCTSLTSVTIPDSVTSIGDWAFYYCTSLTSVTIPDSVTSIGGYAFGRCASLTSVTIPDSVTSIGDGAFQYNTSLTSVTIPDSVTSIGGYAFFRCTSLTSVTIPDSVTSIGEGAFYNCTSLTSVTIGNGVISIGDGAFHYCTSLTSVTIPDSVTSIGDAAFYNCTSLTSVTIGNGVTSIGDRAFRSCHSLTSVIIPDSVISIGDGAFFSCTSLTSVIIPDSVTSIGEAAFWYCTSLTSIIIPDGVTSIGDYAFAWCTSLTGVTIPDSVTSIGSYAFQDCSSLTSIIIPDGVTSIGDGAFAWCTSLTGVYFYGNAPSLGGSSVFAASYPTVYYLSGTTGWGATYGGRPTALWQLSPVATLSVTPPDDLVSSGPQGGPFSPSYKDYTLTNTGGSSMSYAVSKSKNWVSLSKTGGTLAEGASTTVRVSINSNADSLSPGNHSDTVSFTNTTNGLGDTTRDVNLTVQQPEIDEITVGQLQVTADSIVSSGTNKYSCSGNVIINDILKSTGTVNVDIGRKTIKGNGKLYLTNIPVVGTVTLYQGAYTINGARALTTSINTGISLLKVGGVDVEITSIAIGSGEITVQGRLCINAPWGKINVNLASQSNYIKISKSSGISFAGTIRVDNLTIPGTGFRLEKGRITWKPQTQTFEGQFDVRFPGAPGTLLGDARFMSGDLTSVGLGLDNINYPLDPWGVSYLKRVYGRFEWEPRFCFTTTRLDGTSGDMAVTIGPSVSIGGEDYFLLEGTLGVTIDSSGYFEGRGKVFVFTEDFELAYATLKIDKKKGVYVEGGITVGALGIDIDADGKAKVDWQANLQGLFEGRLRVGYPWRLFMRDTYGNASLYCENGFAIAWAKDSLLGKVGVEYSTDGGWGLAKNFDRIEPVTFMILPGNALIIPETYSVPDVAESAVFYLTWESGDTDFTLVDPDGVHYTPALVAPSADARYMKDSSTMEACYVIAFPKPGIWHVDVPEPASIGRYELELLVKRPAPAIVVTEPGEDVTARGRFAIRWEDSDPEGEASVSLYYDEDDSGLDGTVIATDIAASSPVNNYYWNTASVPTGRYYVYAKIDDGRSIPEFSYSPGAIEVTNRTAPEAPANLAASAGDGIVSLSWDENTERDLLGYRVYYTSNLSVPGYDNHLDAGSNAMLDIQGLENGHTHKFCVTAVDSDLNESLESDVVYATPASASNNSPSVTSTPERYARVGVPYSYDIVAADPDGDSLDFGLVYGPGSVSGSRYSWTPTEDHLGNNAITVGVSDGRGGAVAQDFVVTVASISEGNLLPSFVSGPPLEVIIGEISEWTVEANDPDGDSVSYRLLSGPDGLEFDPAAASVFWIPRGYQEGVAHVTFEALDERGGRARRRFAIRVRPEAVEAESNFLVRRLLVRRNTRKADADRFMLRASFNMSGYAFDWAGDAVTIQVGPYEETLPAGSFFTRNGITYIYISPRGVRSGITRGVVNLRTRTLTVSAMNIDMSGIGENVYVRLTGGDFQGACYVDVQPRGSYAYGATGYLLGNVFMIDRVQFILNKRLANRDRFILQASLCSAANVDLVCEDVTITVGELSWTLPAGSFRQIGRRPIYIYRGGRGEQLASVQINLQRGQLRVVARDLDLSGLGDAVTISISGGTFSGSATIELQRRGNGFLY